MALEGISGSLRVSIGRFGGTSFAFKGVSEVYQGASSFIDVSGGSKCV